MKTYSFTYKAAHKFRTVSCSNFRFIVKVPCRVRLFATPWTVQSMEFSRPKYWRQPFPSSGDLPSPVVELMSATLQADSLPAEPQGQPKNTGVGSLPLLQGVFPTQESNRCLLHCRQILYQLSYQGLDSIYMP